MRDGKVAFMGLTVGDRARTIIMEGMSVSDRPTAVGYFVLDTLRSWFRDGVPTTEPVILRVGLADPKELDERKEQIPLFIAPGNVEDLGALYKILLAVSSGNKELLDG
jgi:hypothetical protein